MTAPLFADQFTAQHLPHLQRWLADPAVHRNLYALYRPMDAGELNLWLERELETDARMFFYRTTPAVCADTAAGLGLVHYIHPKHGCGELSLIVNPACSGKGFGRRIMAHLMETAFNQHGLHKIFFHCAGPNSRMIDIATRAGFVQEGVYREEIHLDGKWYNTCRFGMLKSEYANFLHNNPGRHNVSRPQSA
jgi:RimJ/RimL family protein N-acetyltransferase